MSGTVPAACASLACSTRSSAGAIAGGGLSRGGRASAASARSRGRLVGADGRGGPVVVHVREVRRPARCAA